MHTRLLLTWTALSVISSGLAQNRADMILIPVTVLDYKGATVNGLDRERFTLLQDNVPQDIVSFSRNDLHCSVGIIVDTSGSMYRQLDAAKSAVRSFLETAAAGDEAAAMTFAARPAVHSGFTADTTSVWNSLQPTKTSGSMLDTLYLALSHLRSAHNPRRALLVVSDGIDDHSRYSKIELMRVAMESEAQIYSVSIGIPARYKKPAQITEERKGLVLLDSLADSTGGLHFTVEYRERASQAAAKVGQTLRNQYLIGYRPHESGGAGKWHTIQVKLNVPKVTVYARSGYYSR
jgi:Ca-activated chloride channel family protein